MAAPSPLLSDPGLDRLRTRIDERLLAATRSDDTSMDEMASHIILAGGKRLRPVLTALASLGPRDGPDDTGGSPLDRVGDDAVTGGVAVELVHAGSLHHDDVIDEARTRHGVESTNARWGNLRAILSGDFLLARASELASSLGTEVAGLLAGTIGRLCEGEVRELGLAFRVDRTEADYDAAVAGKTAALYATAARIGGIVGGRSRADVEALTEFGRLYGMAFQVVDDVLDVVASDEELGKPAGHDMAEGVYNLPALVLLQETGDDAAELRALLGGPLDDDARERARDLVRRGPGVTRSVEVAREYVGEAVATVAALESSTAAEMLATAARSIVADLEG